MSTLAWSKVWRELGQPRPSERLYQQLIGKWCEPHRHYHTLRHLRECLAQFERVREQAEHPGEVALALWFHDAVYDASRKDNEVRSADWAQRSVLQAGLSPEVASRVHALVLATRHTESPEDPDTQLLVDVDLSILGAPAPRFDEFGEQVRAEYAHLSQHQYREGRRRILGAFLERPRIYCTPVFRAALEDAARSNLARALERLKAPAR